MWLVTGGEAMGRNVVPSPSLNVKLWSEQFISNHIKTNVGNGNNIVSRSSPIVNFCNPTSYKPLPPRPCHLCYTLKHCSKAALDFHKLVVLWDWEAVFWVLSLDNMSQTAGSETWTKEKYILNYTFCFGIYTTHALNHWNYWYVLLLKYLNLSESSTFLHKENPIKQIEQK